MHFMYSIIDLLRDKEVWIAAGNTKAEHIPSIEICSNWQIDPHFSLHTPQEFQDMAVADYRKSLEAYIKDMPRVFFIMMPCMQRDGNRCRVYSKLALMTYIRERG